MSTENQATKGSVGRVFGWLFVGATGIGMLKAIGDVVSGKGSVVAILFFGLPTFAGALGLWRSRRRAPAAPASIAVQVEAPVAAPVEVVEMPVARLEDALQLLKDKRYAEAMVAYEQVMTAQPKEAARCSNNIGACHFYEGNYEAAIEWYERARVAGADAAMIAENIQEARGRLSV